MHNTQIVRCREHYTYTRMRAAIHMTADVAVVVGRTHLGDRHRTYDNSLEYRSVTAQDKADNTHIHINVVLK